MVILLRWEVAREVVRSEGVIGLSRGLGLTVLREVPAFGAYCFAYETFYKYGNFYAPNWPALVTMVRSTSSIAGYSSVCRGHGWSQLLDFFLSN